MALIVQGIPHRCEAICPIKYLGECVGMGRADMVIGNFIVELKVCAPAMMSERQNVSSGPLLPYDAAKWL